MERPKYTEAELVQNRVSVLLMGGTAVERKAWAEEAAGRLQCPLTLVASPIALPSALAQKEGVVLIEDALSLGEGAQQLLVRCLQTQEERPKLVVGLQRGGDSAFAVEGLRPDLHYALRLAQVHLDEPGLRDTLRARRAAAALAATAPPVPARPRGARPAAPKRPARAKKKAGKRHKPRPATAKRSRR